MAACTDQTQRIAFQIVVPENFDPKPSAGLFVTLGSHPRANVEGTYASPSEGFHLNVVAGTETIAACQLQWTKATPSALSGVLSLQSSEPVVISLHKGSTLQPGIKATAVVDGRNSPLPLEVPAGDRRIELLVETPR